MAKIILTTEVTGLGAAGDVVEVKNGYARNYLFPRGFATPWSRGGEKQIESIKAARAAREVASLEDAQVLAQKLTSATVTFSSDEAGSTFACRLDLGTELGVVHLADHVAQVVLVRGLGHRERAHPQLADRRVDRGPGLPAMYASIPRL